MFYVICPNCGSQVEVSDRAVGPERTDLWNAVQCDLCDLPFDYDDDDIFDTADESVRAEPLT